MEISELSQARRDPSLAVLEGFHAVKHALRFGAELLGVWSDDPAEVEALRARLAPDITLAPAAVTPEQFKAAAPRARDLVAVARRPLQPTPDALLAGPGHVVLLENPRRLDNLGAVVRVAAAAGAAAVLCTGDRDPWHPDALRGSAGLHFALPVQHVAGVPVSGRELVALDPVGEPLDPASFDAPAVLAFGTERDGLSDALLARADRRVALPMARGVSSLNLATSVAATLYALKLTPTNS